VQTKDEVLAELMAEHIALSVQLASRCSDFAFFVGLTSGILNAVADRFLVNIQADVIHTAHEEPPWLSLNQHPR
jgi:hypothetical protein